MLIYGKEHTDEMIWRKLISLKCVHSAEVPQKRIYNKVIFPNYDMSIPI